MTPEEKLSLLKKYNPFVSSSVGDPWSNPFPDVPSIYAREYEQICRLLEQKKRNPNENFACLVTGEAGSGKTHLIGRLLEFCKKDPDYSFAYIQPLENHHRPFGYLLGEIMTNLTRKVFDNGQYSQLDRQIGILYGKLLNRFSKTKGLSKSYRTRLEKDPFEVFSSDIHKHLLKDSTRKFGTRVLEDFDSQFDDTFLSVLFLYRFEDKKRLAVRWLKGLYVSADEARELGIVSSRDRAVEETEQEARCILRSLGLLFSFTHHTMIPCFDRLENLDQAEQSKALGKALEYFIDVTPSFLPIVFYRGETWERDVVNVFNQQITTRLETNRIDLQGCDTSQSLEIIRSRLSSVSGEYENEDIYPFDEAELSARFATQRLLPREVIIEANREFRRLVYDNKPLSVKSSQQVLQEEYGNEIKKLDNHLDDTNPDRSRLSRSLDLYMKCFPEKNAFQITKLELDHGSRGPLQKADTRYMDLLIRVNPDNEKPFKVLFMIDDSDSARTIQAYLKRGIRFLSHETGGMVIYVRDKRSVYKPLPNWKSTHEQMAEFISLGGRFIQLDTEYATGWYALTEMEYRMGDKDLTLMEADGGLREITRVELNEFVRDYLHQEKFSWFFQLDQLFVESVGKFPRQGSNTDEKASPIKEKKKLGGETEELSRQIVATLASQKLSVEISGVIDSYRFTRYQIKPILKKGTTVKKIKNQAENLQVELGIETPPFIQAQAGYVSIDIPKKTSKPLHLKEILKTRPLITNDPALSVPLGMSMDNEPFWVDFSDPGMSSMLVGGSSGSGKSVFLKAIIAGLTSRYKANALKLVLIDPKRVTFGDYTSIAHSPTGVIMDNQAALKALSNLVKIMEKRYKKFEESKAIDIVEYNRGNKKLPRYVILIDEYADLMIDKKANARLEQSIQRIGQKGRAAGIHLIVSTQRPDSKVITPLIKANLQFKVAFKVTSLANSMIILDHGGAECLMGKGDMLIGGSVALKRLQAPLAGKPASKTSKKKTGAN
jgi:Ni2+-binding GTPase involved in maturation of urease and hydrogenase